MLLRSTAARTGGDSIRRAGRASPRAGLDGSGGLQSTRIFHNLIVHIYGIYTEAIRIRIYVYIICFKIFTLHIMWLYKKLCRLDFYLDYRYFL